jgi:hypothetical protein
MPVAGFSAFSLGNSWKIYGCPIGKATKFVAVKKHQKIIL